MSLLRRWPICLLEQRQKRTLKQLPRWTTRAWQPLLMRPEFEKPLKTIFVKHSVLMYSSQTISKQCCVEIFGLCCRRFRAADRIHNWHGTCPSPPMQGTVPVLSTLNVPQVRPLSSVNTKIAHRSRTIGTSRTASHFEKSAFPYCCEAAASIAVNCSRIAVACVRSC